MPPLGAHFWLAVESHLEPDTAALVVGAAECLLQAIKEYY